MSPADPLLTPTARPAADQALNPETGPQPLRGRGPRPLPPERGGSGSGSVGGGRPGESAETAAGRAVKVEPKLSPEKGNELLALLVLFVGLFLTVALASYLPTDPSFFHRGIDPGQRAGNLVGRIGAEISAFGFGVLGVSCLVVPVLLLATALRRLRRRQRERVVGRGIGAGLLLIALPGLLQQTVGRLPWRGAAVESGGLVGVLLVELLEGQLNSLGTGLLLVAATVVGTALVVQSTLFDLVGSLLAGWRARLRALTGRLVLWRARRAERRQEAAQRDHFARSLRAVAIEDAASDAGDEEEEDDEDLDLPLHGGAAPAARPRLVKGSGRTEMGPAEGIAVRPPVHPAARTSDSAAPLLRRGREAAGPPEPVPGTPARQVAFPFADDPTARPALPPLNLLSLESDRLQVEENELVRLGEVIRKSCSEFGVEGTIEGISPGPVITVFELQPAPGVKVSQIVNLQDDLALALKAESVRIDRLPGRSTLGIEVPNTKRSIIRLGSMLSAETFRKAPSPLTMAIGTTIHGEPYYADLATMPHLLVAGATGSGKSVGLQAMITSILYKATRAEVQFIFIDPKRIELGVYNEIPHLKTEVVVEPKKAANALRWAVGEMERRYRLLAEVHVRSIDFYNRAIRDPEVQKRLLLSDEVGAKSGFEGANLEPLPYYVIVIDELADLMMVASADVETSIARLAQMARAVGIHLIVATQRPSVDVLTGTIKANFPCRMAFATASRHDSRTILDTVGSEKLLGKGDMLFMPPGSGRIMRLHGAYISEQETAALVRWQRKQGRPELDLSVLEPPVNARGDSDEAGGDDDNLYDEAARLVVAERMGSASFLQRRMRVGFSRAARLIDLMERDGLLGPSQGSKPREVLVPPDYFTEVDSTK